MAITITQSPLAMQPASNPVIFYISSNNTGQPNFRFIAEIKNSGGTVLAKLKFPIIPSTTTAWIDIHRILENYVTHDFSVSTIAGTASANSWFEYSVSFGEEYGSTPTEYLGLSSSGSLRIWNASLQALDEFPAFALNSYITASATSNGRWLSAFGTAKKVALNQIDFLSYITDNATAPDAIKVVATRSGGTTTSTFSPGTISTGRRVYRFPSGPENLNDIVTLISGTPGSVIPADTISYTIQLQKTGTPYGPVMTYTIDTTQTNFDTVDAFFLNRFGGVESFRFDRLNRIQRKATRSTYQKAIIEVSGGVAGFSSSAESLTAYHTEIKKSITVHSNWLTEAESLAVMDLVFSPVVYLYIGGQLRAVTMTVTDHEEHKRVNDKMTHLELRADFAVMDRRQSR
jgi:hypothetical protein